MTPIVISLVAGVICLVAVIYLAWRQLVDVARKDNLLRFLSWVVFILLLLTIILYVPSIMYRYYRLEGIEINQLRDFVSVTGAVREIDLISLLLIFRLYRYKEKRHDAR